MVSNDQNQASSTKKVRVYIDGFNLYHAICETGDQKLKWLNFWALSKSLLRPGETLDQVDFFTAILRWNAEKQNRHVQFLKACRTVGVTVHEANFKKSYRHCEAQGRQCKFFEEKKTDVAIAVHLLSDAMQNKFDRAILITADSDQIPAAEMVSAIPEKQLTLLIPPGRQTVARDLCKVIGDWSELSIGRMGTCLLPRTVLDDKGRYIASMPAKYDGA